MLIRVDIGCDDERIDPSTASLRRDLAELDITAIDRAPGFPTAEGSRGFDAGALSALLVSVEPGLELLKAVVATVGAWLKRDPSVRNCTLEIAGDRLEMTGLSEDEQRGYAEAWIRMHAGG